ncbi:hypothetical protein JVT61DRAFT_1391 [Boletus reticuloceps]|uniref:Fungal-type protein kinase domain-containing protein n=1 Tax=Boletus reticuloceps TaxID=495285 RepID=A0A8I2YC28_9AGAM|nr:hypothetical protein JVT61DRAFT_1391 [Boletus reticuloceps]
MSKRVFASVDDIRGSALRIKHSNREFAGWTTSAATRLAETTYKYDPLRSSLKIDLADATHDKIKAALEEGLMLEPERLNLSDLLDKARERWLPTSAKGADIPLLMKRLTEDGLYLNRNWAARSGFPQTFSPQETAECEISWALFFNNIMNKIASAHGETTTPRQWVYHGNSYVEARRKPDIILAKSSFSLSSEVPTSWNDVLMVCEVKHSMTLHSEAEKQVHDKAWFMMSSQVDRASVLAFTMCGTCLTVYIFSRNGCFSTEPVDVHTSPELLIEFLALSSFSSTDWLGYDHSFAYPGSNQVKFNGVWHTIISVLFHSQGIGGRGTRVLLVLPPGEDQVPFIIKDTHHSPGSPSDGELHRLLLDPMRTKLPMRKGMPSKLDNDGLDELEARGRDLFGNDWEGNHVPVLPVVRHEEDVPLAGLEEIVLGLADQGSFMRHLRTAFNECTMGISWFSCAREFIDCFAGAVLAHALGYHKQAVLHCDISDTNVWVVLRMVKPSLNHDRTEDNASLWTSAFLDAVAPCKPADAGDDWYPKRCGMLGDWGFAQDLSLTPDAESSRCLTGTFPFQAIRILKARQGSTDDTDKLPFHPVHQDLESFFWVLWILCVNIGGPFCQSALRSDTPARSIIPDWAQPGPCGSTPSRVAVSKCSLIRWTTSDCLSDYFGKYPSIVAGLGKLWDRFQWQGPNKPTENQMTHLEFLEILAGMREGINATNDPYPSPEVITAARDRYRCNLARGCPVLLADNMTRMSQKAIYRSQRSQINPAATHSLHNTASSNSLKRSRSTATRDVGESSISNVKRSRASSGRKPRGGRGRSRTQKGEVTKAAGTSSAS